LFFPLRLEELQAPAQIKLLSPTPIKLWQDGAAIVGKIQFESPPPIKEESAKMAPTSAPASDLKDWESSGSQKVFQVTIKIWFKDSDC